MTTKEKAMKEYTESIIKYCREHGGCEGCVFETEPDEYLGDTCPFHVQPMYFDIIPDDEPTVAENAQVDHFREATKKIELMEE